METEKAALPFISAEPSYTKTGESIEGSPVCYKVFSYWESRRQVLSYNLIRQHNNANVLVMPGRFIDEAMAAKIMDEFFASGRHQARIDKIPVA